MRLKRYGLVAVMSALLLAACGRKGDPTPPVPVIPQGATDLVVTQRGPKFILSWSFPTTTTAGTRLPGVSGVTVWRHVESLPIEAAAPNAPSQQPGANEADLPPEMRLFSTITPPLPQQFERLKERVGSIEGAALTGNSAGSRILFEDTPPFRTSDNRPMRVTYAVTSEATGGARSPLSNLVTIVPLKVSQPPAGLSVTSRTEGVHINWSAPPDAETTGVIGYNIYRFPPAGEIRELGKPINNSPVTGTGYDDAPAYGQYRYAVTAVRMAGPPTVESDPTPTIYAEFKDVVPPPVPVNVVTLTEERAVRLLWDPLDTADLQGFRVYRRAGGGTDQLLTPAPITETNFRDEPPQRGVGYIYSVASVDKLGNESAKVSAAVVTLPQ
jgi:hypothetical protein